MDTRLKDADSTIDGLAKKSKRKWIIAFLLLLVVIAVAAAAYYFVAPKTQTPKAVDKTATHFSSSSDLVTGVKTTLKGTLLTAVTVDSTGGLQADGYYVYSLPSYRAASSTFFNKPAEGTGAGYASDSVIASSNYKKLTDFFLANNFDKITSEDNGSGYISSTESVTYVKYAMYESPDMVCAISDVDATPTVIKNHISYIACATKDNYKKAAEAVKPFVTAYTKANKDADITGLTFASPSMREAASGYKTAVLYQDDLGRVTEDGSTKSFFQGLYYMAPGSSDWTFFAGSDLGADLACSVYATDAAMKAFAGFSCINDTTKKVTVVQ